MPSAARSLTTCQHYGDGKLDQAEFNDASIGR